MMCVCSFESSIDLEGSLPFKKVSLTVSSGSKASLESLPSLTLSSLTFVFFLVIFLCTSTGMRNFRVAVLFRKASSFMRLIIMFGSKLAFSLKI